MFHSISDMKRSWIQETCICMTPISHANPPSLNQGNLGSRCTKKTSQNPQVWTSWRFTFMKNYLSSVILRSTQGQWYLQIKYSPRRFLLIFRSKYSHIIIEYHRSSRYFHESHTTYIFVYVYIYMYIYICITYIITSLYIYIYIHTTHKKKKKKHIPIKINIPSGPGLSAAWSSSAAAGSIIPGLENTGDNM